MFRGGVPPNQHAIMRAPFQDGAFPGPVKYGYLNVGTVEDGPRELLGRTVFCLYPHQTRYVVPAGAVSVVPDGVPPGRAILAGTVETAVNALWDAAPLVGDRVAVVGAGMVGCSVAGVLAGFPGSRVQLVDTDPSRAASPARSASSSSRPRRPRRLRPGRARERHRAGLARSLELVAPEGEVVELSWYGDRRVSVPLGEFFHSRRLTVRASQVGAIPPSRRSRRTFADRLALALRILADPAFDALITGRARSGSCRRSCRVSRPVNFPPCATESPTETP